MCELCYHQCEADRQVIANDFGCAGDSVGDDDDADDESEEADATAADATRLAYDTGGSQPERNLIEKARRRLEGLVGAGKAERRDDHDGLARYFAREEP